MRRTLMILACSTAFFLLFTPAVEAKRRSVATPAGNDITPYSSGFTRWSAASGGFAGWEKSGTTLNSAGELVLHTGSAASGTDPFGAGAYNGANFYNGRSFMVGEATSPVTPATAFREAIPSWNATTPPGTCIETQLRARIGDRWTKWYNLGVWAEGTATVRRHSVKSQGDANGSVSTDTLKLSASAPAADAIQVRIRLFSETGVEIPSVRNASVATSPSPSSSPTLLPGDPSKWNRLLDLPQCSQMVYPDGGNVWCSPTATSMVLAYLRNETGPCEPRVRHATNGTWDWIYAGFGNWPFNTAYAATSGNDAYVARYTSMRAVETWIAHGVPVVFSFGWSAGQLTGAAIPSSPGHLAVIVGFDANGDPIVNDPAAPNDASVRRTYRRAELERLWLRHSGGTVYLIYPPGTKTPAGH
jgi:hypothetical protein